jgi:predicted HTH transcriptional regulator
MKVRKQSSRDKTTSVLLGFEAELWATANALRGSMDAAEYKHKEVIVVEVPPQSGPVGTTAGRYLRRALGGDGRPCCLPMFFHEMQARQADRGAQDYAATYRRLGQPAAYVRQRGFEPLQQEQMVLQYVEKHGRITRREAAELCRLAPSQAYRLLKQLEEAGKIRRIGGSTKGVRYGLPRD